MDLSMCQVLPASAPAPLATIPSRRLVAAGTIRRHHGRTFRLTATAAGVTGSIRPTAVTR